MKVWQEGYGRNLGDITQNHGMLPFPMTMFIQSVLDAIVVDFESLAVASTSLDFVLYFFLLKKKKKKNQLLQC